MTEQMLFFPLRPVIALAEHAIAATERSPVFSQREAGISNPPAALHWAKDGGTYLLSNGLPRTEDVVYASTVDGLELRSIDPRTQPDLWTTVRTATEAICGGDDFVESFDLEADNRLFDKMRAALDGGFATFVLVVHQDTVEIGFGT